MRPTLRSTLTLFALIALAPAAFAQGPILSGVGPVNRSMGSAATAAPLDPVGTLYWNPAGISALKAPQLELGLEMLYPRSTLRSSIPAGAAGPGVPSGNAFGFTRDEGGVFPLPAGGFVFRRENSCWTYGLGLFPVAGFGVNYPGRADNPILSPPPPVGLGVGPIYSTYQVLTVAPTVAYQLTDRLSIGMAPLLNLGRLGVSPGVILPPDDANGDGVASYPNATNTRFAWGAGFQIGAYFVASDAWSFGTTIKSPQWFESYRFTVSDELGRGRVEQFHFDLPMVVSVGAAYRGIERLTLATDVRYLNFRDTAGFRRAGFAPTGEVVGLGFDDSFSVAIGAQYELNEKLNVRLGYTYNTRPLQAENVSFNLAAPLTYQHQAGLGASYRLSDACTLSAGYYHVFYTPVTGPYLSPAGAIPGASISTGADVDSILFSIRVAY